MGSATGCGPTVHCCVLAMGEGDLCWGKNYECICSPWSVSARMRTAVRGRGFECIHVFLAVPCIPDKERERECQERGV